MPLFKGLTMSIASSALAAAVLSAPSASAEDIGAYLSFFAGASIPASNAEFTNGQTVVDTDFDTGFAVGGAIGYRLNQFSFSGFTPRVELEASYSENGVDALNFSGNGPGAENVVSGSKVSSLNLVTSAFIDADELFGGVVVPYVGAGAGIGFVSQDIVYNGAGVNLSDRDTAFLWHVTGGAKYAFTERASAFADVGFRQTVGVSSLRRVGSNPAAGAGGGVFEDDLNNIVLRLGITVDF
ncbi:MAG: hypothetical protein AAF666_09005 [Pseudomonadota bacterium]